MPFPYWPPTLRQLPRRESWTGGPQDTRASFKPDVGPPIQRRRVTGDPETFEAVFPNLTGAMRAAFKAFYATDLAGGVRSYCWRDPVLDDVALWRILGSGERGYDITARGADRHDLSLRLMRLSGTPWFATYMRAGSSRPPFVVADYVAGVFGIDGAKTTAADVALVAGTFNVYRTSTTDVETLTSNQVIVAGGFPATAPSLTKRIVAFLP